MDVNNRRTGKDATKPRALGALGTQWNMWNLKGLFYFSNINTGWSNIYGSVNVHRGALLLVPKWQCISSFVFYITKCNNFTYLQQMIIVYVLICSWINDIYVKKNINDRCIMLLHIMTSLRFCKQLSRDSDPFLPLFWRHDIAELHRLCREDLKNMTSWYMWRCPVEYNLRSTKHTVFTVFYNEI